MGVDQEARDMAKDALARQSAHEDVCAVRYKAIADAQDRATMELESLRKSLSEGLKSIYNLLWKGVWRLVTVLLAVSGFLIVRALFS